MSLIQPTSSTSFELRLTVVSGPDAGQSMTFRKPRISVGRSSRNDFVLSDGFVSNRHGLVVLREDEFIYRDLQSRHGSLVVVEEVSMHLHDKSKQTEVAVSDGAEMQLGATLLRLTIERVQPGEQQSASSSKARAPDDEASRPGSIRRRTPPMRAERAEAARRRQPPGADASRSGEQPLGENTDPDVHSFADRSVRETLITTAHRPVSNLNQSFEKTDRRLGILFRLAGQLNGITAFDDLMETIVEATFEAFPAANFFALTLIDDVEDENFEDTEPFMTRMRGELAARVEDREADAPLLSKSILRRVVSTCESVLFVKDSLGTELTKSIIDAQITACMCAPLVGQRSLLGVMQVDTRGHGSLFAKNDLELFNVLASNVAFALERTSLSENIVEMFESFVHASVNAIEARDPTTAGHSERVAHYTTDLARAINEAHSGALSGIALSEDEITELHYAALLHDFGKIGVREDVLNKGARLHDVQLEIIEERFETIKASMYHELVHKRLHELSHDDHPLSPDELEGLQRHFRNFCRELDELRDWLDSIARKPYLTDEEVARVERVGARTFVDVTGRQRPFLLEHEIENLCIQRGTLNEEEWDNMRSHAAKSEDFLEMISWSDELADIPCIAGAHHEKLDGSGYPLGLQADEILPQVRMLTISDIFDALTAADRPYRKAAPVDRATFILREEAGQGKLDEEMVELFCEICVPRIRDRVPGD